MRCRRCARSPRRSGPRTPTVVRSGSRTTGRDRPCSGGRWSAPPSTSVKADMTNDPDQIRAQVTELLGESADGVGGRPGLRRSAPRGGARIAGARAGIGRERLIRVTRRARVDAELVRRGLARSRQQAAELIGAGRVRVDGMPAAKPATAIAVDRQSHRRGATSDSWVSRGAHKLIGALDAFGLSVGAAPVPGRGRLDRWIHRGAAGRATPARWSPSTSATASWPGRCAPTRG